MAFFSGSLGRIKISIRHCCVKVKLDRTFTKEYIRKTFFHLTPALSRHVRGNLTISPHSRGGDKREGVAYVLTYSVIVSRTCFKINHSFSYRHPLEVLNRGAGVHLTP